MKTFRCDCGQRLFFENTCCLGCGRRLGYDPAEARMHALVPAGEDVFAAGGHRYRLCRNYAEHGVCNWLVPATCAQPYCLACDLNEVIPNLAVQDNLYLWAALETAKRRLLYTLLALDLPVRGRREDPQHGLAFAFLQDQRSNPQVNEEYVLTGHTRGLITVNLAEADAAFREQTRLAMRESYRTLLGHLRHESGHHYFGLLVGEARIEEFRTLFGDERDDYDEALRRYYAEPSPDWQARYISRYAQAHPLEDWAECWAHYLHMVDTLETAAEFGIVRLAPHPDFDEWLSEWLEVTVALNELNRSMGLNDAYPFVLSPPVVTKLRFVHRLIDPNPVPS